MLVMGSPQFSTQDDFGCGDGIAPSPQWHLCATQLHPPPQYLDQLDVDPSVANVLVRLRTIFHDSNLSCLSTTDLHDLTCFVVHRLLSLPTPAQDIPQPSILSECIRLSMALYMFIIHGPTYYSHAAILYSITVQLKTRLDCLTTQPLTHDALAIWLLSVGMVSSIGTPDYQWFMGQADSAKASLGLQTWEDILIRLKNVLWLEKHQGAALFQRQWGVVLAGATG
jgi:hypothetical protein